VSFRRILIGVDDSLLGDRAANVGVELARALGPEMALVHVVNPPAVEEHDYDAAVSTLELITDSQNRGREVIAATRQRIMSPGVV
jgi:nucleotide-binding universal stress UspA family protein